MRELKEECEERNKLYKDAQQSLQEMQEERWFYRFTPKIVQKKRCPDKGITSIFVHIIVYCLRHILAQPWIFFFFWSLFVQLSLRDSLAAQLEITLTKADSEQLARSIAEEQYSDLEKEKIMKELELKEMMARHRQEVAEKDITISSVCNAL